MKRSERVFYWLFLWGSALALTVAAIAYFGKDYATAIVGVFASISGVLTASIAYIAATAKLEFDREIHNDKERERKITVYIKAIQAAEAIKDQTSSLSASHWFRGVSERTIHIPLIDMRFEKPSQLTDVWNSVGLLPDKAIVELRFLTTEVDHFHSLCSNELESAKNSPERFVEDGSPPQLAIILKRKQAIHVMEMAHSLYERAIVFIAMINEDLPLNKATEDERLRYRHGDPMPDPD